MVIWLTPLPPQLSTWFMNDPLVEVRNLKRVLSEILKTHFNKKRILEIVFKNIYLMPSFISLKF